MQLIGYIFSAVNVVPSNFCVVSSPIIIVSFFLLATCTEERIATSKYIQFLPNPLPAEKVPFLSNPIPYPEYLHFLGLVTAYKNLFINLINTVNVYFLSMSICNIILF